MGFRPENGEEKAKTRTRVVKKRKTGGKVGSNGEKTAGLGVADEILAKFRAKQEKKRMKHTGINPIELIAMKKLGVESKEELVAPGTLGEKLANDLASQPVGFQALLFRPGLCKEIGRDIASGRGIKQIADKYNVEIQAVRKYAEDYVAPVLQKEVQNALKEQFAQEDIGLEGQQVRVVLKDDQLAHEWAEDVEGRLIPKRDYKVYKSAYMTRAAITAKQAAGEGVDEAATEQLKQIMANRATETVGEIFKVLAGRKSRRDIWMERAFDDGKFNVLPGLSGDELADLKLMAELSGLETAVKAELKVAQDTGAQQTTNVMMVRMDGIEPASRATIDVSQPRQQTNAPAKPVNRLPLHKLFPLDVGVDNQTDKVTSNKGGGMVVERVKQEE